MAPRPPTDVACARAQNLDPKSMPESELASALSKALGGPTIVQKGREDRITNGREQLISSQTGSSRRCGGQGDVLSGAVGTFLAWGKNYEEREAKDEQCVYKLFRSCSPRPRN